jgi:hypothetical protein
MPLWFSQELIGCSSAPGGLFEICNIYKPGITAAVLVKEQNSGYNYAKE